MHLLPHQARIISLNPPKALLNHEMRTGKSLIGATWVDLPEQAGNTYIITKKSNKKSWQEFHTQATVLTKEEFKKVAHTIKDPTAIVVDECHHFGSALFVKGRSQLATALYNLLKKYPDCHFLGLSGSVVRNSPWSFHTLLCYIGVYIPWKGWRSEFFELQQLPFLPYPAWMPRSNWRELMQPYLQKYTDIVSLKDVVEYLPPATARTITIKQKPYKRPIDKLVTWTDEHRHEQQGKVQEILDLDYRKLILVCKYTEQIDALAKKLSEYKPTYILDGRTKKPEETIYSAQEADECYFIVQASCGEGWDGWQFGAMVFVSMDWSYVSNLQMHGRQRHPKYLRDIEIIYLIGGRWDAKILKSYNDGEDFNPHTTGLTEDPQAPRG